MIQQDPYNAFCRHTHVELDGAIAGPLHGLSYAVKDVFDIDGYRTGNGNPVWLETHAPAGRTASSVERLLAAGARMIGKTHTDELAYSLNGENIHYGTPVNRNAPGRIPGGSSSGSAAAVAGGLVDFALGTDCGGSIRLPASYCGIYGIRTTHGLIPADGIIDLAASFDTVGWFARDVQTMRRVGAALLPVTPDFVPRRLLIAEDAFAFAGSEVATALVGAVKRLKEAFAYHHKVSVYTGDPAAWPEIFRILQGDEIRRRHGAWIDAHDPGFGPGIAERSRGCALSTPPRSCACGGCARTSPDIWTHCLAMTPYCACRLRRASRLSWRHLSPNSRFSARAPSHSFASPAWRACRKFHCRSAQWRIVR